MTTSQSGQGAVSNILAVAGFIILIAIIVWGAFHFFNIATTGFGSLFGGKKDAIAVTLSSKEVNSGQALDVSWKHTPEAPGSYAILYQCRDNFQFRSVNATGIVNAIPCGSAVPVGNESLKNIRLIPALTGNSAVDVTITVTFAKASETGTTTASARPQGSAAVKINPQSALATPTKTNGSSIGTTLPSTGTTATTPTPAGKPDLVVRILAVGVIDSYSGTFMNRAPTSQYDIVAVKFDIANQGSGPTGVWSFTAQLPTAPASPYISPQQVSLEAGGHIENTLRFNNVTSGGAIFSVSVDPTNAVGETNESNNYTSQWVSGLPGQGGYGQGYYPYQY